MTHEIQVSQYKTIPSSIKLGTFDSYGTEQLHFTFGSGWEDLAVYATFTPPNGKSTQTAVDLEGYTDVPAEATAEQAGQGEIVLVGKAEGVNRITVSLYYTVMEHGPVQGAEPAVPTPDLLQQILTLSKDAQEAAKNAEKSAANAVKDATDTVKLFKEETVQAAAGAALSEKSAAESKVAAQKAAEFAVQAGIAAGNAADAAEKAAGTVTVAAGNSALNAESAQRSAQNAQQSATASSESQSAAKASADAAAKSSQSAAIDAKTATDAKVAAAGSADAAAGSANAAENSASAAAGSEQAAGTSEERAAKSEGAAKASADAAAKSAQAALESKNAAATSEGNAAASAKKAQDVADSLPEDYTTAVNEIAALKTNKADKSALETVKQQVESITPDDSSVGEKPWSSKNIVDMLCPPLEESGNPVVRYPVAGYPLGVKAKWEPTQEGTGTPSPENIRPIKGRSGVKVERCGENLLAIKPFNKYTKGGITYEYVPDGGIHISGTATTNIDGPTFPFWHLPPGKYYVLDTGEGIAASIVVQRNGKNLWLNAKGIFEIFTGDVTKYWYVTVKSGATLDKTIYPYIVPGTTAPTTYKPYIGQTNTLALPETVYGGEVDAVRGEGAETWKLLTLDGTEEWMYESDTNFAAYNVISNLSTGTTGKCSHHTYLFSYSGYCIFCVGKSVKTGKALAKKYTGIDEWKSYLAAQYAAGTPVQVCYKLAEPVPFTATGAQPLPALSGTNTVLTDADSATVTGRADPIKRIEDLEAAVASIN